MADAEHETELTATDERPQQRRRRPRPGTSAAAPSEELASESQRSRRSVSAPKPAEPLATVVPSALGEGLHAHDRKLLRKPKKPLFDDEDVFPEDQEPAFLTQPPVPTIGGEDIDRYAEGLGRRRFQRVPRRTDGEQPAGSSSDPFKQNAGETYFVPPPPSGGTQAAMTFFGMAYHACGGILAGISLAQSICSPGFGRENLVLHMAYASVALTLQKAVTVVGLCAFLGAADRHVCRRTYVTGLTVSLTALVVFLLALQLPPDAVMHHGRRTRDPSMLAKLQAAGDDPVKLELEDPDQFPEFVLETSDGLSMALTYNMCNYQQLLLLLRTLSALTAWVLACHEDPYTLFSVPPLERSPRDERAGRA